MRFLEQNLYQVLDNLGITHDGVSTPGEVVQASLDRKYPLTEVMESIWADLRYAPFLVPHPYGVFLFFENVNVSKLRALVDFSINFRVERGQVVAITSALKRARVFSRGQEHVCLSLGDFRAKVQEVLKKEAEEKEAEILE